MAVVVKRPTEIVPLGVVAALADLFSLFSGPTKHMTKTISAYYESGMAGKTPFVDYLLIKIPLPYADTLVPLFGVSDWIIVVFLTAAANKFDLNDNIIGKKIQASTLLCFPVASMGLFLAIVAARVSGIFIPALPFVVVLYLFFMTMKYAEMRKLTKTELIPLALFSATMILLVYIIKNWV